MCMSSGNSRSNEPAPPAAATPSVQIPATQQNMAAATPGGHMGQDPSRPKVGARRARENARYADSTAPNTRRNDTGGITM